MRRLVMCFAAVLIALMVFIPKVGRAQLYTEVTLTASDAADGDAFGSSVAIFGDTAIVGARNDDDACPDNNVCSSGSAYIFERNQGGPNNWGQVLKLTSFDAARFDFFGNSVAISNDTAIVGAEGNDDKGALSGSAYIFGRNQGGENNWGEAVKLTASDGAELSHFGGSVAISGDTAIVGAYTSDNAAPNSGSAYIFERNYGGTNHWGERHKLTVLDAAADDHFGDSVAIFNDTAIVGAFANDDDGPSSGSAYIFQRNHGGTDNWGQILKLTASDADVFDLFGDSVAISNDTAIVGALGNSDEGEFSGSAYVFDRNQGGANNWGQVLKLTASDAAEEDEFGTSVAISGDTAIVGASYNDDACPGNNRCNSGSAYVFNRNQGGAHNWGEKLKLTALDAAANDVFGTFVAVAGDTTLVGAPTTLNGTGSAYIYYTREPSSPCDFNGDSSCHVSDINAMFQQGDLVTGVNVSPENAFDLSGDLTIGQPDIDQWLEMAATENGYSTPYRRGDTDDLGAVFPATRDVDITDFNHLAMNFLPVGTSTTALVSWDKGNFDGDNDIDITDFNSLALNFAPAGYAPQGAVSIPEPSGLALVGLGWLCLVGYRWVAAN